MACVIRGQGARRNSPSGGCSPVHRPPLCLAEFEIWYSESFLISTYVQKALKPGGNIRPGMIPINRVTCLVSCPGSSAYSPCSPRVGCVVMRAQLSPWEEEGTAALPFSPSRVAGSETLADTTQRAAVWRRILLSH